MHEVPKAPSARKEAPKAAAGARTRKVVRISPAANGPPAQTPMGPMDIGGAMGVHYRFRDRRRAAGQAADVEMPPSSMTKLMTAYIVFRS
ncbi:MAG: hypothetical protein WDN04_13545 [Rhodospirillales bacterium]